jgi:transposase
MSDHLARYAHRNGEVDLERRKNGGDGDMEGLRVLERRLSEVVYRALLTDETDSLPRTA